MSGQSPIKLDILYTITRYVHFVQLIPHLFICKMINVAQQSPIIVIDRVLDSQWINQHIQNDECNQ